MKRLISLFLIAALGLGLALPAFATIEEQEQRLEELEEQQSQKQEEINLTADEVYLTQASIEEVLGTKQRLEEQIEQTNLDISNKKDDIEKVQKELKKARDEVVAQQDEFGGRLRIMYLNKDSENFLSLLLKSRSIEDFLTKIDFMKSIANEDQRVLDELKEKQVGIEKLEKEEQANLVELEDLQATLEADKAYLVVVEETLRVREAELLARKAQLEEEAAVLAESSQQIRNSIESMKAEAIRIALEQAEAARLAALAAEQAMQPKVDEAGAPVLDESGNQVYEPVPSDGRTSTGAGGVSRDGFSLADIPATGFIWPTPGVYTITSSFGYRSDPFFGHSVFHEGIDIGGPMGSPIVASGSGVVIYAGWFNNGYGNAVIIAHPNGYETVYAHGSAVNTSVGSIVNQGDVVMFMGSTGYSTGSHLHFEVISGGVLVDPLSIVAP
ncbi:MAG: peptidoglycan DD-metalloendopeptidase family protein [Tissierellia bacterium]|nr:peptidoglycan DD-metalloendopeptidase family protein [Tissierellia bacterium]